VVHTDLHNMSYAALYSAGDDKLRVQLVTFASQSTSQFGVEMVSIGTLVQGCLADLQTCICQALSSGR
jgi:hypothetical protein